MGECTCDAYNKIGGTHSFDCAISQEYMAKDKDSINPSHYKSHPSGIECIQITEHMGFNLGNCIKYVWRADLKHDDGGIEDLKKALWYLNRELDKRQNQ